MSCHLDDNSGKTPSVTDRSLTSPQHPMPKEISVHQRRRAPTGAELQEIPWLGLLSDSERQQIVPQLVVSDPQTGDYVCRVGRPVTYWFGVISGLLKMSSDNESGQTMTFTGVPPGGWFGEGTALKREIYRYNIQALRPSVVAGMPLDTFHWLIDHSLGFNRFEKTTYANRDLMLNAVEYLIDPTGVIEARSKEVKLRLLDSVRARDEKTIWQAVNIGLPLVFLGLFGWLFMWLRRRKYAKA